MFTGTPTQNLKLPQFEPGNHPDFLTDFNNAFSAIDKGYGETLANDTKLEARIATLEQQIKSLESAIRLSGKET